MVLFRGTIPTYGRDRVIRYMMAPCKCMYRKGLPFLYLALHRHHAAATPCSCALRATRFGRKRRRTLMYQKICPARLSRYTNTLHLTIMNNHKAKSSKYKIATIVFLASIFISICSTAAYFYKEKYDKTSERRSSKLCQDLYKDGYKGVVVRAKKNQVRVRKLNGNIYKEFNYFYQQSYTVTDDFYVGQNINKKANSEYIILDMTDKTKKEFNIPCWD